MNITPLPAGYSPDFARWRTAVLRQGEPDWVPWHDGISDVHRARVLGRPMRTLADDIAFAQLWGFDTVGITSGLTTSDEMTGAMTTKADDTYQSVERRWANEGEGAIRSHADFESFDWPDPDQMDYSAYDLADRILPLRQLAAIAIGRRTVHPLASRKQRGHRFVLQNQRVAVTRVLAEAGHYGNRSGHQDHHGSCDTIYGHSPPDVLPFY